jgi:3-deoxy-D-manno-octulosonic-acid transferase
LPATNPVLLRALYNLAVPVGKAGLRLLTPFHAKTRRIWQAQQGLFQQLEVKLRGLEPPGARILVHVASVGEYLSVLPLIRSLRADYPDLAVILSFLSPSLENQLALVPAQPSGAAHLETYLCLDTPAAVTRFLDLVEPRLILFASYDIWPNLLWIAGERKIGCALINGILSETSSRYRFPARFFFGGLYRNLDCIGAVSKEDAARFEALGFPRSDLAVTGNCRFDQTLARCRGVGPQDPDLSRIVPGRWLVAGSTWPPDEELLLPAWIKQAAADPELGLIIAPHEPNVEHLQELESSLTAAELSCLRYSQLSAVRPRPRVILVDRVGILYKLYRRGCAAYVGGGFGRGVHNVMEPAGMGLPVIFGPRHLNSAEALQMKAREAAWSVADKTELSSVLEKLLRDPAFRQAAGRKAEAVVLENTGATTRTLEWLRRFFPQILPDPVQSRA